MYKMFNFTQGIDCHIGSQITDLAPFKDAFDIILEIVDRLRAKGYIHILVCKSNFSFYL
jgi:diaminopimelate decarboxylase